MPFCRADSAWKKLKSKQKHPITCAPALIFNRYWAAWAGHAQALKNLTIAAATFDVIAGEQRCGV
jgi:hypothetical protein